MVSVSPVSRCVHVNIYTSRPDFESATPEIVADPASCCARCSEHLGPGASYSWCCGGGAGEFSQGMHGK